MRCLTLANELIAKNATVFFICRQQDGDICDFIEANGFPVHRLPTPSPKVENEEAVSENESWLGVTWQQDATQTVAAIIAACVKVDWLILDHYAIDYRWESLLRNHVANIMVIDDLANRQHDCNLILDQNYFSDALTRYDKFIEPYCTRFLGTEYILLRQEFRSAKLKIRNKPRNRVLLFFGGSDLAGQTEVALKAVLSFDPSLKLDVVVGSSNPRAEAIQQFCHSRPSIRFYQQTENMADLMASAILCLGAGGIATFGRLYMELPSIAVATANNQCVPLQSLADLGLLDYIGEAKNVNEKRWLDALQNWKSKQVKQRNLEIGTRVDKILKALLIKLIPFTEKHVKSTFYFLQDKELRSSFAMSKKPTMLSHVQYWRIKLGCSDEPIFAIESDSEHIGNCGIKPMVNSDDYEGWIYLSPQVEKRMGIGEVAFRHLLYVAFKVLGLPSLYLHVKRDNKVALALYCKIGFQPAIEPIESTVWEGATKDMCKLVISR